MTISKLLSFDTSLTFFGYSITLGRALGAASAIALAAIGLVAWWNQEPKTAPLSSEKAMPPPSTIHRDLTSFSDNDVKEELHAAPLKCRTDVHQLPNNSNKHDQEDSFFIQDDCDYCLVGVCDGHGSAPTRNERQGGKVSKYVSTTFHDLFLPFWRTSEKTIAVFQKFIDILEEEVLKNWELGGTTLVASLIDKQNRQVHTATVGDSEARLYHPNQTATQLSIVKDWSDQNECQRVHSKRKGVLKGWEFVNGKKKKYIRTPSGLNLNLSRTIGDARFRDAVIAQAEATTKPLQPGDVLIVGSDGVWDAQLSQAFQERVQQNALAPPDVIAKAVTDLAKDNPNNDDDITAVVVRID